MPKSVYQASPIKRNRRSNAQLEDLLLTVQKTLAAQSGQITIRHLYYRLVGAKAIEKTESEYKKLGDHLSKWRRSGAIPWDAFVDSTRWYYGPRTFDTIDSALKNTVANYRKNLWLEQDAYLELWVEKDAIASIIVGAAEKFGVRTFVCRGFPSLSSLYSAASGFKNAERQGKTPFIYYLGDHDPSGVAIDESITNTLFDDFGVIVEFERAAVTQKQIAEFNLPTRPTKGDDTRARNFKGESVELDAMPPDALQKLVRDCITQHIEPGAWAALQRTEALERESWQQFINGRKAA